MTYSYFYTPCFEGSPEESVPPVTLPGQDSGSGTEFLQAVPGMTILKYDDSPLRCVLRVPFGTYARPGWVLKTSGEVLADYPGLPGVV